MPSFRINKSPREDLALTNTLLVSPRDFPSNVKYITVNQDFIFHNKFFNRPEPLVKPGEIGTTKIHREWARLSLSQEVYIAPFDLNSQGSDIYLGGLDLEIQTFRKAQEVRQELDVDQLSEIFVQLLLFEFQGILFKVYVTSVDTVELQNIGFPDSQQGAKNFGILLEQTVVRFTKPSGSSLKLKGNKSKSVAKNLLLPDFKFEDMGIGGLDSEFGAIFRRAFASRIFPPSIVEKIGIQHVKGILLHGPPGTGKTLMARQIGKMLNAQEPKNRQWTRNSQ
ncbi:transport between ER and Golgi ATPase protein [Entomophthora muscae]|uniref:Transport between ER and Golgi ATPase protein n=2 Tax=Entomophthora muscae TaxID=34485 RepID=A0ACC2RTF7_9FUNG|nr:transport between ER and Golgi ATPase protein [Entomophthora muscae]KAJ9058964.1 transport between ER and Golgi ATPase protein [Entomophthora muscae]